MIARTYRELVIYQRSVELREMVFAMIATPRVEADRRFCEQVRDAVRSPPRNIAEGFGRYNPSEFAQFLDIALGSFDELDNHIRDGADQSYFTAADASRAIRLCAQVRWMTVRLAAHLRREARRRRAHRTKR